MKRSMYVALLGGLLGSTGCPSGQIVEKEQVRVQQEISFLVLAKNGVDQVELKKSLEGLADDLRIVKSLPNTHILKGKCSEETYERVFRSEISYELDSAYERHRGTAREDEYKDWKVIKKARAPEGLEDKIRIVEPNFKYHLD